jgi:hypothetical protein
VVLDRIVGAPLQQLCQGSPLVGVNLLSLRVCRSDSMDSVQEDKAEEPRVSGSQDMQTSKVHIAKVRVK